MARRLRVERSCLMLVFTNIIRDSLMTRGWSQRRGRLGATATTRPGILRPGRVPDAPRTGRERRRLLLAWAVVSVLAGLPAMPDAQPGNDLFDRYELVIGPAERQTVVTGYLLGNSVADIGVAKIAENGDRSVRIFAFEGGAWRPRLEATLRDDASFVDVARVGARDRLLVYGSERLTWFDPEAKVERPLVSVLSSFEPPREGEIPHVDVTRDVNADGRDDLVVPGADGFLVLVQREGGAFAEPVKIGLPPDLSRISGADGYLYDPWSQSRIHEADIDRNGLVDLVYWNGDHFAVHRQNDRGLFAATARRLTTEVSFDSDRLSTLEKGDMTGRVLDLVDDIDGDGVADLVVLSWQGSKISRKRSTYEVHLGSPAPAGATVFSKDADLSFHSDGRIQLGMDRRDFDGDGRPDLAITTIHVRHLERSLWKIIKGFMGDDVGMELEFHENRDGVFHERPDATRGLALDGTPSHREPGWVPLELVLRGGKHERRRTQRRWPRAFNSLMRIGDVTGDGRADLITEQDHRGLDVHPGVPGDELFAREPRRVKVPVPNDEEFSRLVDLNGDGKLDVLMHHPFEERDIHGKPLRPPGEEPHRVIVLLAR